MSKRSRKPVNPLAPDPVRSKKQWSIEDKRKLLGALERYGHKDMKNICKEMSNKSPTSVKLMMNKMMKKARSKTSRESTALDTWLTSGMFVDDDSPIPQALKFISLFEKHPPPDESGGFDVRAAYDYLHHATLGHPGMDLSPETTLALSKILERIIQQVWPAEESSIASFLAWQDRKAHSMKKYPPMSKLESRRIIGPD